MIAVRIALSWESAFSPNCSEAISGEALKFYGQFYVFRKDRAPKVLSVPPAVVYFLDLSLSKVKMMVHERTYHQGITDRSDMLEFIGSIADPVDTSGKESMPSALKIVEKMPTEKNPIKRMMPKRVPRARPIGDLLSIFPMTITPVNIITGIARNAMIFLLSGLKNTFQSISLICLDYLYRCRRAADGMSYD